MYTLYISYSNENFKKVGIFTNKEVMMNYIKSIQEVNSSYKFKIETL